MMTGTELAVGRLAHVMPVEPGNVPVKWQEVRFPVRVLAKWCDSLLTKVPTGYEDEIGFHHGVKRS